VPGIFAAGDIRSGSIKRVTIAAAEGVAAVTNIYNFLNP
jgi:thioredoxin reductase (NADPH)